MGKERPRKLGIVTPINAPFTEVGVNLETGLSALLSAMEEPKPEPSSVTILLLCMVVMSVGELSRGVKSATTPLLHMVELTAREMTWKPEIVLVNSSLRFMDWKTMKTLPPLELLARSIQLTKALQLWPLMGILTEISTLVR